MALRGKKPEDRKTRLKLLLSGPAGVGKTTAAIQMPRPYVIDTEQGSVHYGSIIDKAGGVVYETRDVHDIISEVRSLITTNHDYLTLVIDPITTVYDLALEEGERKVGNEWGRHYGYANGLFKRLCNLITALDMNVVVTAHEKDDYETIPNDKGKPERVKSGVTYDGYRKLDYLFDLYLTLRRKEKNTRGSARIAKVQKTRLAEFPDLDEFEWSYGELTSRFGSERIEKGSESVSLASPEQVERFMFLLGTLTDEQIKALKIDKAMKDVEDVADMPADRIQRGIELIESYRASAKAA